MRRVLLIVALSIGGLCALAVGVWFFVTRTVETPKYTVVVKEGAFELRDYPSMVAAQVRRSGSREMAVRRGFRPLAGYIFARERGGESIAMTAPVTQQREGSAAKDRWVVQFVMPAEYVKERLPRPSNEDVELVDIPARRVASHRFGGRATDKSFAQKEEALIAWLAERDLEPVEPAILAYYDDPFTPGFLRRNEVLVPVAEVTARASGAATAVDDPLNVDGRPGS